LVLLIFLPLRRHPVRVTRDLLGRLVLIGVSMTAAQFTYYTAISLAGVPTALFLQYTAPVLVALYARVAERELLTAPKVGAIVLAVVGSFFLVTGSAGIRIHPLGLTAGLLSAAAFGVYAILARGITQIGSWTVLLYALGAGAVGWSLAVVPPLARVPRRVQPRTVGIVWLHRRFRHDSALRSVSVRTPDDQCERRQPHGHL
jgi:drug/metabolite transporter (DMT)-like permease